MVSCLICFLWAILFFAVFDTAQAGSCTTVPNCLWIFLLECQTSYFQTSILLYFWYLSFIRSLHILDAGVCIGCMVWTCFPLVWYLEVKPSTLPSHFLDCAFRVRSKICLMLSWMIFFSFVFFFQYVLQAYLWHLSTLWHAFKARKKQHMLALVGLQSRLRGRLVFGVQNSGVDCGVALVLWQLCHVCGG